MSRIRQPAGIAVAAVVAALLLLPPSAASAGPPAQGLIAFGNNRYGELGNATNLNTFNPNPAPAPVTLPGQAGTVTQAASGQGFSLALTSNGQLYAFGRNYYGQLGIPTSIGTEDPNPTPTLVTLPGQIGRITQVAAGMSHSLVLTSSGQLYAFGRNYFGQLGIPTGIGANNPNPMPTLVTLPGQIGPVTEVAAGGWHSLAVTASGQLYAFGRNFYGQLGNPTNTGTNNANPAPAAVGLPGQTGPVTRIAAGGSYSLAVTGSGQLYAFGENFYGQLGNATNAGTNNPNPTPTPIGLPGQVGPVTGIAAGSDHSLAVTSGGQLYAFGYNYFGQLGNSTNTGTFNPNPTPALVTLPGQIGRVSRAATGAGDSLAVTASGQLYAFGDNHDGQLGSATNAGAFNPNPTPTLVGLPSAMMADTAAAGPEADHTLAIVSGLSVSNAKQSNSTWRAGKKLATVSRKRKPPIGTVFSFTLNHQALVRFAFTQKVAGRKVGGKCVAQTKKNRRKRPCKRTVTRGLLFFTGYPGTNRVSFQGRITKSKKLNPGRYTLVITAANAAGQTSQPASLGFTIVK